MIKIRYSDLQPGLHASAGTEGRHTVLYLVPGLAPADRRSAIDRLRASARVGHGPGLPAVPLALALMADRVKQTTRNALAAVRLHPSGLAIPAIILASGVILYALLVTVSMRIGLPGTSYLALGPLPVVTPPPSDAAGTPQAPPGGRPGGRTGGPSRASRLTGDRASTAAGHKGGAGRPAQPGSTTPSARPTPSPATSIGLPSPVSSSLPPASRTPSPSLSPTPSQSEGGGGTSGGHCVSVTLIHVCL